MCGEKHGEFSVLLAYQQESSVCSVAGHAAYYSQMYCIFHLKLSCHLWGMVLSCRKDGACLNVKEGIISPACFYSA